jgi:DDE superfamily endonuclease
VEDGTSRCFSPEANPPVRRTFASKGAAERDEFLRLLWRTEVGRVDTGRLVFVDEMGTHTSLAPLYAYSPIGERAFFEVPRNHGSNTTLLCSLRSEGVVGPSMAVEGATNKEVFEAYAEHFVAPALRPGEIVVTDNLGAHRPKRIRELIESRGWELLYLPPYSPDLTAVCVNIDPRFEYMVPSPRRAV